MNVTSNYGRFLTSFSSLRFSIPSNLIHNEIISESVGNVATITLNRPSALNSLSMPMCIHIREEVERFLEEGVRCLILKGAGGKAFCTGGDVKSIALEPMSIVPGKPGCLRTDFFTEEYATDYTLANARRSENSQEYKKLSQVSIWNGIVMGGGVGISLHGAFRVATENTLFAMPETAIGIFPDVGSSYVLSRLPGGIGMLLGLAGTRLKAADLLYSGLATHYVKSERLPSLEQALISDGGQDVGGLLLEFSSPPEFDTSLLARNREAIERCFVGKKCVEEIIESLLLEDCEWCKTVVKQIRKMSPTSLKLTHRQINLASDLTLRGCFEMDYRMMQRAVRTSDFVEGVRSVLIDKDQNPRWNPPNLSEVGDVYVEHFFDPLYPYELKLPR